MKSLALLEGRTEIKKILPYNGIGVEEAVAVSRVMASRNLSGFVGRAGELFFGGPEVVRFERDFAAKFGVSYAVGFNSATTALQAAIAAVGIGPGDEVITSPFTMSASATAVLLNGAVPVFADIDPATYCIDPESVRVRMTSRTKAIMAVNLFGGSADYDELKKIAAEHGLKIIEDNAQAPGGMYHGRYTGTIGDIGVFSLNVHKVIQCGEGGVLTTNDPALAFRAQLARNHGEVVIDDLASQREFDPIGGSNYRLSELHAAIAAEQLKKLDGFNAARRELAAYLDKTFKRFSWITPCAAPAHVKHVYYMYPFRFHEEKFGVSRKTFANAMASEGFPLAEGYVKPLYLMPIYQKKRMFPRSQFPFVSSEYPSDVSYEKGICPVAERMYESEILTTSICQPPNTRETIEGLFEALVRIEDQVDTLRQYEKAVL